MATGTVQFEKINGGLPYRTAFYTKDEQNVGVDGAVDMTTATISFAPMYSSEQDPTGTITVRSYEIYIDETIGATGDDNAANTAKIVTRLAKVAPEGTTDYTNYDVQVITTGTETPWTISSGAISEGTLTIVNKVGVPVDIRVVYVCEVTA